MPKNIAIVAGGDSSEYIVSVASAANIEKSLDRKLFKPWLITIKGKTGGCWVRLKIRDRRLIKMTFQ
jgi:D-alanine-D-alanine ligase-like ATP-grasp enzyme